MLLLFFVTLPFCRTGLCRASEVPVPRLINPEGVVTVLRTGRASWEKAHNGRELFAGDTVRTGPDSRVSILCPVELQLKLNQIMIVTLKSVAPSARMGMALPVALYDDTGRALGTAGQLSSDCYDLFTAEHSRDLASGTRTLTVVLYRERLNGSKKEGSRGSWSVR